MSTDRPQPAAAEVVLHQEQLRVGSRRVAVERVVLRRRVVTEVRQVEVTVRREELEVQRLPLSEPDAAVAGPSAAPPPLMIVLSEEVPVVQLQTRPYEQVRVVVQTVTGQQEVTGTVGREQAEFTTEPAASPAG